MYISGKGVFTHDAGAGPGDDLCRLRFSRGCRLIFLSVALVRVQSLYQPAYGRPLNDAPTFFLLFTRGLPSYVWWIHEFPSDRCYSALSHGQLLVV